MVRRGLQRTRNHVQSSSSRSIPSLRKKGGTEIVDYFAQVVKRSNLQRVRFYNLRRSGGEGGIRRRRSVIAAILAGDAVVHCPLLPTSLAPCGPACASR